ncbi:MAG TPA: CDP-alcohol phosphatidyltransferase family protein [Geobacteraceae bacterium]
MNLPRTVNIPNAITIVRILLVPALVCLLLHGAFGWAIWIFLAAGLSDALDGFIAKRFSLTTRLGAILDPLADKLLVAASVIVLAGLGFMPWWLALTAVSRDVVIIGGAIAFHVRCGRVEMAPSVLSKVNTFIQLLLIFLVLGHADRLVRAERWLPVLFVLAFLTTVVSGVQYVVVWGRKAGALPPRRQNVIL